MLQPAYMEQLYQSGALQKSQYDYDDDVHSPIFLIMAIQCCRIHISGACLLVRLHCHPASPTKVACFGTVTMCCQNGHWTASAGNSCNISNDLLIRLGEFSPAQQFF